MSEPQRITLEPEPPVQGKPVKICYDFTGLALTSTNLRVTFSPGSEPPTTHEVTPANPCVTITVPADAEDIRVEDLDGPSPDKESPVAPSGGDG